MAACAAGWPLTPSVATAPAAPALLPASATRLGCGQPATPEFREDRGVRARIAGLTLDPPKEGPC